MKQKKLGGEISSIKNLFNRNVENSEVFRYVNMITSTNSFILGFLERHQDIDIYQKNIEEKPINNPNLTGFNGTKWSNRKNRC